MNKRSIKFLSVREVKENRNGLTAIPQDGIIESGKWAGVRLESLPLGRGV
jgi:hypothetical protein